MVAEDLPSQLAHGICDLSLDLQLQSSPNVGQGIGNGIILFRKNPIIDGLTVTFDADTAARVTTALGIDLGACVTVSETMIGSGTYWVDGIEHELQAPGNLVVILYLGLADTTHYAHTGVTVTNSLTDVTAAA